MIFEIQIYNSCKFKVVQYFALVSHHLNLMFHLCLWWQIPGTSVNKKGLLKIGRIYALCYQMILIRVSESERPMENDSKRDGGSAVKLGSRCMPPKYLLNSSCGPLIIWNRRNIFGAKGAV